LVEHCATREANGTERVVLFSDKSSREANGTLVDVFSEKLQRELPKKRLFGTSFADGHFMREFLRDVKRRSKRRATLLRVSLRDVDLFIENK